MGGGAGGAGGVVEGPCRNGAFPDDREACPASIYEVRTVFAEGDLVAVEGTVTGVKIDHEGHMRHLALQVPSSSPDYDGPDGSGLWVFVGDAGPFIESDLRIPGNHLRLVGHVHDFEGQRQLARLQALDVVNEAAALPDPVPVRAAEVGTGDPRAEALEGVLVAVADGRVTDADPEPGPGDDLPLREFVLDDALRVDDYLFRLDPPPVEGSTFPRLAGILRFDHGDSKLLPRSPDDVTHGPVQLASFGPARTSLPAGPPGVPADEGGQALTIALDQRAGPGGVAVEVSSDAPEVLELESPVRVQAGSASASVFGRGLAPRPGVTVTVRLGEQRRQATVDVTEAVPSVGAITLRTDHAVAAFGETLRVFVGVDLATPAGAGVLVTWEPPDALFGGGFVFVPGGELEGQQDFTVGQVEGEVRLTASLDVDDQITAEATVVIVPALAPGALVVNEVAYDQADAETREFVEIYNPHDEAVPLAPYRLELVNGSNGTIYSSVNLLDAGPDLPPRSHLVVGSEAILADLPEGPLRVRLPGAIQNGEPDGLRLVDRSVEPAVFVDGLAYGGPMVGTGEGEPAVEPPVDESLSRCRDGRDSGDNASDFRATPPSPGANNLCF